MKKYKQYDRVHFSPEVLQEAIEKLCNLERVKPPAVRYTLCSVVADGAQWFYDSLPEFLAAYRRTDDLADFYASVKGMEITFHRYKTYTSLSVEAPSQAAIEEASNVFEKHATACRLLDDVVTTDDAEHPVVFIGHGRSPLWRDLKDHLHEKHGYRVEAYEIGARAGHAIRDVLGDMLNKSSFALLVMTGEDVMEDDKVRARQNVVHEVGLFQGRLGFSRAIVVLEAGTEEFSNIHGIDQIRFSKGNIKEVYGDVLATLRREFSPKESTD